MSRKSKNEELVDWLKSCSAFLVEVDFITYKVPVCILANTKDMAHNRAQELYPACATKIIGQLILAV